MHQRRIFLTICLLLTTALFLWGSNTQAQDPGSSVSAQGTNSTSLQSGVNTDYERHQQALKNLNDAINKRGPQSLAPTPENMPLAPTGPTTPPYSKKILEPALVVNPLYPPGIGFNPAVDYTKPNFAQSPNIRKFVDGLPGLGLPSCTLGTPTFSNASCTGLNAPVTPSACCTGAGTGTCVAYSDGTCNANNLGQFIPIANPDTATYPGSDYYELSMNQYKLKMHTDLPAAGSTLRGYKQTNNGTVGTTYHGNQYLGPAVIAQRNRAVRFLVRNQLPLSNDAVNNFGNLPLPVDKTLMGAGYGPVAATSPFGPCDMGTAAPGTCATYTENRSVVHLHGGLTPWISDGTPHQWFTPAGDPTPLKKGLSFKNVTDMIAGANCVAVPATKCVVPGFNGDGIGTYYYTNQQSPRLLFFHEHAYGITRQGVYDGFAAPYLITDPVENDLIMGTNTSNVFTGTGVTPQKILPDQSDISGAYIYGIPLVIQDKSFVNDVSTPPGPGFPTNYTATDYTATTDPLWYAVGPGYPGPTITGGNLWFPHEYMPIENIFDPTGNTPNGRWDYAPFMIPPMVPKYLTLPSPTIIPEGFMDTATVNGTAFPYVTLPPEAVRFRILSVGNDRTFNLHIYSAAVPPALVTFGAGCTTPPIASTQVYGGVVKGITLLSAGAGCTAAPTVTITDVFGHVPTAAATATATVDTVAGVVTGLTLTGNGSGYLAGTICKGVGAPPASQCTEVSMVPAAPNSVYPTWPVDGRDGGVPDPTTQGPSWIMIGNESGFLAKTAVIPPQPIDYEYNRQNFPPLGVTMRSLLLMPAMRADVIVDFSKANDGSAYQAGDTLIMYNDAPAPMPGFWTLNDYYSDDPDQRSIGGAPPTPPGFGPNTRTIMQIRIAGTKVSTLDYTVQAKPTFDRKSPTGQFNAPQLSSIGATLSLLQNTMQPRAFAVAQDKPLVPQMAYKPAYPTDPVYTALTTDTYVQAYMSSFNVTGTPQLISKIKAVLPGNNYTVAPTVSIIGGGCTPAPTNTTATAGLNPIGAISLLTTGAGYTSIPVVTLGPAGAGGVLATALATVTGGAVTAITVDDPGSNYSTLVAPTCVIAPPTGCVINTTTCVQATCSAQVATANTVGHITINTPTTCNQPPIVMIVTNNPGGTGAQAEALLANDLVMTGKNMTEGFDVDYGRMDIRLGSTPNPLTPNVGNGMVVGISQYFDPPTEIIQAAQPILWRITHLGVDSHALHFHLFDLQIVNRVDWSNVIKPPYEQEIGYRETIRTNPMEDIIIAIKPKQMTIPFSIPDSNRPLDPTTPVGSTTNFNPIAPLPGVAAVAQTTNLMTNFASEYVWHCHLLGHEENDMMRPIVFQTPPWAPKIGTAVGSLTSTATVNCTAPLGTGGSPITSYTATSSSTNPALPVRTATGTACPLTVTGLTAGQPYTFTVKATNAIGTGPSSNPSNTVVTGPPQPPTNLAIAINRVAPRVVVLTWTNALQAGSSMTVQRATNASFTTGVTNFNIGVVTSYNDTTTAANTLYYYRVRSAVGATVSAWSSTVMMSTAPPAMPVVTSFTAPLATQLSVAWTEAQTSGTNNWAGFEFQWTTDPLFSVYAAGTRGPQAPFTQTMSFAVVTGTTYYMQMRATNSTGPSAWTTVMSVTTP